MRRSAIDRTERNRGGDVDELSGPRHAVEQAGVHEHLFEAEGEALGAHHVELVAPRLPAQRTVVALVAKGVRGCGPTMLWASSGSGLRSRFCSKKSPTASGLLARFSGELHQTPGPMGSR